MAASGGKPWSTALNLWAHAAIELRNEANYPSRIPSRAKLLIMSQFESARRLEESGGGLFQPNFNQFAPQSVAVDKGA